MFFLFIFIFHWFLRWILRSAERVQRHPQQTTRRGASGIVTGIVPHLSHCFESAMHPVLFAFSVSVPGRPPASSEARAFGRKLWPQPLGSGSGGWGSLTLYPACASTEGGGVLGVVTFTQTHRLTPR